MTHKWQGMQFSQFGSEPKETGYDTEKLREIVKCSVDIPEGFQVHSRLRRMYIDDRLKSLS